MLPKTNRLTLSDKKYKELQKTGRTTQTKELFIVVNPKENKAPTKFAVIVPKKLDKRAVRRNRTRRLIAAAVHGLLSKVKDGHDVMIMARRVFYEDKLEDVLPVVREIFEKAKLTK
jgi:ribonuclease P protein component